MAKQQKPKEYKGHTSVSLKEQHIELLQKTAEKHNLKINDLMILLLRYVTEHSLYIAGKHKRVKYQKKGDNMQIINLYIGQRDYERNMDARRFTKFSVSWLLAYAIDHFLTIVVEKINEGRSRDENILNNWRGLQTFLIKKKAKRIKMVSVWYPMRK